MITIRCTRSRGPRVFFCLHDFRRGPVNVAVIPLNRMITKTQAAEWILDCDGSCRDVTFTPTGAQKAACFVQFIDSEYTSLSSNDNNGIDRTGQLGGDDPLLGIDGFIHYSFKRDGGLISALQLMIDHDTETDEFCVEVSFFPQDINLDLFSLDVFMELVNQWNAILQSKDFFIRYENVSWDLYDPKGLGVIYSRSHPPV